MTKIFIDTDVLIDFLIDRRPFSDSSTEIFIKCADKKIEGYITPVIIANVFYILRKTLKTGNLKQRFIDILKYINVLDMNKNIVLKALYSDFNDFEDALQNFTVSESPEIKIIVTRNVKDYTKSTLSIHTPESFLKTIC